MTPREHAAERASAARIEADGSAQLSCALVCAARREPDAEKRRLLEAHAESARLHRDYLDRVAAAYQAVAEGREPGL